MGKRKKNKAKKNFINGTIGEMKKVKWPTRKEMIKYSITTLIFIVLFAGFFYVIDVLFALLKGWIG